MSFIIRNPLPAILCATTHDLYPQKQPSKKLLHTRVQLYGKVLYVGGCQAERLYLGEFPVERLGGDEVPQSVKGGVDTHGPVPLSHVRHRAGLLLLSGPPALLLPRPPHPDCRQRCRRSRRSSAPRRATCSVIRCHQQLTEGTWGLSCQYLWVWNKNLNYRWGRLSFPIYGCLLAVSHYSKLHCIFFLRIRNTHTYSIESKRSWLNSFRLVWHILW